MLMCKNGDVLFELIRTSLCNCQNNIEQLQNDARVDVEEERNPIDFVLWKMSKPNEPSWSYRGRRPSRLAY